MSTLSLEGGGGVWRTKTRTSRKISSSTTSLKASSNSPSTPSFPPKRHLDLPTLTVSPSVRSIATCRRLNVL